MIHGESYIASDYTVWQCSVLLVSCMLITWTNKLRVLILSALCLILTALCSYLPTAVLYLCSLLLPCLQEMEENSQHNRRCF